MQFKIYTYECTIAVLVLNATHALCKTIVSSMFTIFGVTIVNMYLLGMVVAILSVFQSHSLHFQCEQGGSVVRFDWKNKGDVNVDESRYPGEWLSIDCRLPDITIKVSLWRGEGSAEKEIIPKQHKITELNQVFNITKLTLKDEGNYYCKACNRTDKSIGYLYINSDGKAYQTPKISNKTEGKVSYGNILYMDCEVSGWYEMKWYKDYSRQPLQASVNLGYWTSDGIRITKKRLIIEKFTEVNNGLYTCEVQRQNVGWKSTDHVSLKAKEVKPALKKTKEIYVIDVNDTQKAIVLRCEVEKAYPPAVFEWNECIHALYNCSSKTMGWFERKGNSSKEESLLIVTKQEFQTVSYWCTAKNYLGQDSLVWISANKNGITSLKPRIIKTPQFETAGDNLTMVCQSNGSVVMKWKKKFEKLISKNTSYKRNGFNVTRKSLEIPHFMGKNEGLYECHIEFGKYNWTDNVKINITMKVKPKIIKGSPNLDINFEKGMELTCELLTKAVPNVEIRWSRCICDSARCSECNEWSKLQNISTQTNSESLSKLQIQSMAFDRVIYRCAASNVVGSDERKWIIVRESVQKDNKIFLFIIVFIILVFLCILLIIALVLYRRKNLYGGFYIITTRPIADHVVTYEGEETSIKPGISN